MENDLKHVRLSLTTHIVSAFIIALVSASIANTLYAAAIGFAVLFALGFVLERFTGKRGIKWWLANGLILYLIVWYVGWILFINL